MEDHMHLTLLEIWAILQHNAPKFLLVLEMSHLLLTCPFNALSENILALFHMELTKEDTHPITYATALMLTKNVIRF
jgi:hypothetical protein